MFSIRIGRIVLVAVTGLNPCCDGMFSITHAMQLKTQSDICLNPCCDWMFSIGIVWLAQAIWSS